MQTNKLGLGLFLGYAVSVAVLGILLKPAERVGQPERSHIDRPAAQPDDRFGEPRFYRTDPRTLILYTAPGFRPDINLPDINRNDLKKTLSRLRSHEELGVLISPASRRSPQRPTRDR